MLSIAVITESVGLIESSKVFHSKGLKLLELIITFKNTSLERMGQLSGI